MSEEKKELVITDDLKPVLEMLTPADAGAIVELREELGDNWRKKQIFRTETEMRISVLNDAKHPTNASKYWQSVREQGAMFDALMGLTFDLRRSKLARRKLIQEQKELKKALENNEKNLEIIAHHISNAIKEFDNLLGKISPDDILESVFSNFCVGK